MATNSNGSSRCFHWPCRQILWTAWGIRSCSKSVCYDWSRQLPQRAKHILLQGFIALWSGASIGPEGTLSFLATGLGTFVSERLRLQKDDVQVKILTYSAIAGAFGGFFGSPIVGAVGAVEYMFIKELNLYRHLIPGLIAGAVGYGVYFAILQTDYLGVYSFPDFASLRLIDLGWALLVGVIAGLVGILHKLVFGLLHRVFGRLNKRPVVLEIIGGSIIWLHRFVSPIDTLLWPEPVARNCS